jgi:hypothetical protein
MAKPLMAKKKKPAMKVAFFEGSGDESVSNTTSFVSTLPPP